MFIYIVATTLIFLSTAVSAQLPQLKLPWGTWEGTPYPQDPNVSSHSSIVFHLMLEKRKNKEWSILIKVFRFTSSKMFALVPSLSDSMLLSSLTVSGDEAMPPTCCPIQFSQSSAVFT